MSDVAIPKSPPPTSTSAKAEASFRNCRLPTVNTSLPSSGRSDRSSASGRKCSFNLSNCRMHFLLYPIPLSSDSETCSNFRLRWRSCPPLVRSKRLRIDLQPSGSAARCQPFQPRLALAYCQIQSLPSWTHSLTQSRNEVPPSSLRKGSHPFTQTTCFKVWTISTRSAWAAITASIGL